MSVEFFNQANNNYFSHKHLHVIKEAVSVKDLINEGRKVLRERRAAANVRRDRRATHALVQKYGSSTKPSKNTLIVLSLGGLECLKAEIEKNNGASGWYSISNGAIFNADTHGNMAEGISGRVHLSIRSSANMHEVYHLHDCNITVHLKGASGNSLGDTALGQLKSTAFSTTPDMLSDGIKSLKHVSPPGARPLPAIVLGIPGLDLSFLDD